MKKLCLFFVITAAVLTACQQKPVNVSVDIEAEKAAIDSLFDKFIEAFNAQDVTTLVSYLTDDALCMGTDPSEFWNKQQITDIWSQMLADTVPVMDFFDEQVIKVAADGHSATAVQQYMMPDVTLLPWRNTYHLIKKDGHWMIFAFSCGFIPKNEELPKINEALK
ncbi:MAG: nuclear transport factor 2 family protein [Bacteroidales bacterium]|nr:nuclear transport factor 2 family protein [Bacteroidales bacterium]